MRRPPITPSECAARISAALRIAVLTGAGMSTAAGVPDFRGPKGLYVTRAYDPEAVFEISAFDRNPKPFYDFTRDFFTMLDGTQPTPSHRFLATLENAGKSVGIITQNIDGLHQRAGSTTVLPIHGDYQTCHCRSCRKSFSIQALRDLMAAMPVPLCPDCGGVIKPDVVFFGENVRHLDEAARLAAESDLMLVLGSSLSVYPAATLPDRAGGEVVVVNRGPTGPLGRSASASWADADLDEFFSEVAANLGMELL